VLDFDDNGSELANLAVHQKGSEKRVIPAFLPLIADQDSHDAAGLDCLKQPLGRTVHLKLKIIKTRAVAKVVRVFGIADNIPIRRMVPDKVELSFREAAG